MTTSTGRKSNQKSVHLLLRESPVLLPVFTKLAEIASLNKTFHAAIPVALHNSCRITHFDGSTAIISAASGAVATKLKQLLPQILTHFQPQLSQVPRSEHANATGRLENAQNRQRDQELTGFRVEVQPAMTSAWPKNPGKQTEPRQEIPQDALLELSRRLLDSPLKAAVETLIKQRAKDLKRTTNRTPAARKTT
jgi:hypothetical protein